MAGTSGIRLKSVVIVPKKCQISFKVIDEKNYTEKLLRLKVSQSRRKLHVSWMTKFRRIFLSFQLIQFGTDS